MILSLFLSEEQSGRVNLLTYINTSMSGRQKNHSYIACLHDKNKSGFFGGPAFIQPIRAI